MSQEVVELVRRSTAAYNRRDIDEMLRYWAPDAVVDWSNSRGTEAGVYRGHEGIRLFAQRFFAAWEEVRIEIVAGPEQLDDGLILAENLTHFRGRDGIAVQARSAWLITVSGGVHTSLTLYQSREEALEAAGQPD